MIRFFASAVAVVCLLVTGGSKVTAQCAACRGRVVPGSKVSIPKGTTARIAIRGKRRHGRPRLFPSAILRVRN